MGIIPSPEPVAVPVSASRYPIELLQQIFEFFYPKATTLARNGTRSKAGRSLLKLSLVCKRFHAIAQKQIYEEIQLDATSLSSNALLHATLQNPSIAQLIRTVDWISQQNISDGEPDGSSLNGSIAAASDSRQILRLCTSVTSLIINSTSKIAAPFFQSDAFRSLPLCQTLQALDVTVGQAHFPKAIAQFISTLPALTSLVIHKCPKVYHDNTAVNSLPLLHADARLQVLELYNVENPRGSATGWQNLDKLIRADSLTKLSINQPSNPWFDPSRIVDAFGGPSKPSFASLTHLSITGITESPNSSFVWLRLFNLFPCIKHLSLTAAAKENEVMKSCFEAFRESPSFHTVRHMDLELSTHFTAARFVTLLDEYQPDQLSDLTITCPLPRQRHFTFPEGMVTSLDDFLDVVQDLTQKQMEIFMHHQKFKMNLRVMHEKRVLFALTSDEDGKPDGKLRWVCEMPRHTFLGACRSTYVEQGF